MPALAAGAPTASAAARDGGGDRECGEVGCSCTHYRCTRPASLRTYVHLGGQRPSIERTSIRPLAQPADKRRKPCGFFDNLRSGLTPAVEELHESWDRSYPEPLRGRELPSRRSPPWPSSPSPCAHGHPVPPERAFDAPLALALVATYALLAQVRFPIGYGFTIPTQVVLVPMLFLLPLGSVPLFVAAGMVLGKPAGVPRRRSPPEPRARRRWPTRGTPWAPWPCSPLPARTVPELGDVAGAAGRARGPGGGRQRRRDAARLGRAAASRRSSSRRCSAGSRSWTCCCRRSACWRPWPPSASPTPSCSCSRSRRSCSSSPSSAARACARRSS